MAVQTGKIKRIIEMFVAGMICPMIVAEPSRSRSAPKGSEGGKTTQNEVRELATFLPISVSGRTRVWGDRFHSEVRESRRTFYRASLSPLLDFLDPSGKSSVKMAQR